jgi:hypothetical protein
MHIERWKDYRRLAQHHLNLPAMVRLVIENMRQDQWGGIVAKAAGIVYVTDFSLQETLLQPIHEFLDARIFALSSCAKTAESTVELGMKRRRGLDFGLGKPGHPQPVAEQDVIERQVKAPESAGPFAPVVCIGELRTRRVQALVRASVVPGHGLKVARQGSGLHGFRLQHSAPVPRLH